jgi:hypothetical protein
MMNHEQAIREAAIVLRDAIAAGEAIGLRVDFPRYAKDLGGIAISETKRFDVSRWADAPAAVKLTVPKRIKKS